MPRLALLCRDTLVDGVPDEGVDERERWQEDVDPREQLACEHELPVIEPCQCRGMIAVGTITEDRDRAREPGGLWGKAR
jgi:hypothetical protein